MELKTSAVTTTWVKRKVWSYKDAIENGRGDSDLLRMSLFTSVLEAIADDSPYAKEIAREVLEIA